MEQHNEAVQVRDCAEARKRHQLREPFVLPLWQDTFPGSPWQSAVLTLPIGKPLESEGTTNCALFAIQGGVLRIWMSEELRDSPYVHFWDGRPIKYDNERLHVRPKIGGKGYLPPETGWELRCDLDDDGALHIALPTHPDADPYIVWWREQTPAEWQGSPDEYEHGFVNHAVVKEREHEFDPSLGWESITNPRTQCVYYRRRLIR